MSIRTQIIGLILLLAICLGAGALGAVVTTPQIDPWYQQLNQPTWAPPNWVFGPVWTTLYVLMALAAWLVWRSEGFQAARVALLLFAGQLLLNSAWSWIFFGMQQPGWAFFEIVLLWVAIVATIVAFFRHCVWAGLLMIPYLAWTSFAAVLNYFIWQLNRS